LGGVESLIEQRLRSDPEADPRLIRLSIGVEDVKVTSLILYYFTVLVDLFKAFAE
jgi:cystathionine beta-lyase/cystathionine gamma-synthase